MGWWRPLFPLAEIDKLVVITWYDSKYLTLGEESIIRLLGKIDIMDSCTIIDLWLRGDNYLVDYLCKIGIIWLFYGYFQIACVSTLHSFVDHMVIIYAEEWRNRWENIQSTSGETYSPQSYLEDLSLKEERGHLGNKLLSCIMWRLGVWNRVLHRFSVTSCLLQENRELKSCLKARLQHLPLLCGVTLALMIFSS